MNKKKKIGDIAIIGATLIWGSSFVIMKDTLNSVPTFYLLAIRFLIAAILLAAIGFKELKKINLTYIKYGIILGVFLLAAYVTQTLGLKLTTPGKNAFLTTAYCIIVPFLYWIIAKRRPDKYNVIAACTCILGIGILSLGNDLSINNGDLLTLVGGFFFACHIIALSKATEKCGVLSLTMLQFFTAGLISLLGGLIFEKFPDNIPGSAVIGLSYLTIFATTISLLLQSIGQKYTHPATAAVLLTLESVFGAAISVILGRDVPSIKLFVGFAVMFIAVLISETKLDFLKFSKKTAETVE